MAYCGCELVAWTACRAFGVVAGPASLPAIECRAVDDARARVDAVNLTLVVVWVHAADYSGDAFFSADGAGTSVVGRRSRGTGQPGRYGFTTAHGRSAEWGAGAREGFSDLRFTDANRVPFPFARDARQVRSHHGRDRRPADRVAQSRRHVGAWT